MLIVLCNALGYSCYSSGYSIKRQLELINPSKKARKGQKYKNSGTLFLSNIR